VTDRATEALQARDHGCQRGRQRERGNLPIQFMATARFVLEQRRILAKHDPVFRRQHGVGAHQAPQPLGVRLPPRRALPTHQATARQEFEEVVAELENFALKRRATPHEIAHAFFGFGREVHGGEFTGTEPTRELRRIVFVVRALHTGFRRNQRWRDHRAGDAPRRELALQHVPRARRLVTRPQRRDRPEPFEIPAELLQVVRRLFQLRRGGGIARQHRDGDRLLVHIEFEEDC
jgi:hypothetical protein